MCSRIWGTWMRSKKRSNIRFGGCCSWLRVFGQYANIAYWGPYSEPNRETEYKEKCLRHPLEDLIAWGSKFMVVFTEVEDANLAKGRKAFIAWVASSPKGWCTIPIMGNSKSPINIEMQIFEEKKKSIEEKFSCNGTTYFWRRLGRNCTSQQFRWRNWIWKGSEAGMWWQWTVVSNGDYPKYGR